MNQKTLNYLSNKNGSFNQHIINSIYNCRFTGNRIYYVICKSNGGFYTNYSYDHYIKDILDLEGYKYIKGNDGARGGKIKDYLEVSTQAIKFLEGILTGEHEEKIKLIKRRDKIISDIIA